MPPPNDAPGYGYGASFYETITSAINAMTETGYVSAERVAEWVERIRQAALRTLTPPHVLHEQLNRTMRAVYQTFVERGGILKFHPGVPRFTLERIKPRLREELDRRILAAANLVKLNRERVIEDTLRRFSGWATSIPAGGSSITDRAKLKEQIRKPLASAPFETRRVLIDQAHKLRSSLSEILAVDGGALAGHWVSHYNQANYNFRPEHKHFDVDDKLFIVRGNWAMDKGLMRLGGHRYVDEIERPGELPFCRCYYQWIHSLNRLPPELLTKQGVEAVSMRLAA